MPTPFVIDNLSHRLADTLSAIIRQAVMLTDPKHGLAEFPGELPAIAGTEVASGAWLQGPAIPRVKQFA